MLINKATFRKLIGYLKVNSDLLHPANHGNYGDPHGQLNHKYRGARTISSGATSGWTKLLNIKNIKSTSNATSFFHVVLYPEYTANMETFDLYIFIKVVSGTATVTTYLQARMYNKNYIMSKIGACYSIKTNNSDLIELDFYAQLNKSYLAFNFEILRAHNSVAWFLKERSALDSITLLSAQPLILKTEIPSPVDVQKNIGYGPATSGFHDTGEYIQNLAIGVGEPVGWVCSVAGTSGTWLVVGQQGVRVGTKANRPPSNAIFSGYVYMDTTMAPAGKPMMWNGVNWIDSNGVVSL